ncbi:TFIID-18kDa-domain-containing protein [Calocera viscosa TUFC12733]|uniref:TFIID-18kDa-domain-containing protein n=1 Tax=Calocera viscosa (strain TUFC12733) TaxID=1330018 RepID=A0A167QPY6_CALVF|nr:TFIID-18kDa-domain-containing protein [Calocera viscosa TUFC12733]
MSKAKGAKDAESGAKEYKYQQEIAQMLFVFGEVPEPLSETTQLVEDIVRGQVIEIVILARHLAVKRGARHLTAEDLMFLIRGDRGKVNRLRTYLSWKEVRREAKEASKDSGANLEEEAMEENAADLTTKSTKMTVKLPWEISTIYSDFLKHTLDYKEDYKDDEDGQEATEDMNVRLKDADEATRKMTREEYVHYSECRQASFTFRKSKRFREFINFSAYSDIKPNDDIIDILGFLAYEMVRSLCIGGLEIKRILEEAQVQTTRLKRKLNVSDESPIKKARLNGEEDDEGPGLPPTIQSSLFMRPPEARTPLRAAHIQEAFARMQRDATHLKGAGMTNWRGGLVRTKMTLI